MLTLEHECIFDDDVDTANLCVGGEGRIVYKRGNNRGVPFARVFMNAPRDMLVDHINGNVKDNRRENLRLATRSQNCMNRITSRNKLNGLPKGVYSTSSGKYQAMIRTEGKLLNLGSFLYVEDAAEAYQEAAEKYQGEFATHLSRKD